MLEAINLDSDAEEKAVPKSQRLRTKAKWCIAIPFVMFPLLMISMKFNFPGSFLVAVTTGFLLFPTALIPVAIFLRSDLEKRREELNALLKKRTNSTGGR